MNPAFLSLSQPWWPAVLVLLGIPTLLAFRIRQNRGRSPVWAIGLQCLALAAAAGALADPAIRLPSGWKKPILVLRDASASTRGQQEQVVPLPAGLPFEVVLFAEGLGSEQHPPAQGQTVLTEAMRLATSRKGKLEGVIIQTDGRFQDDWMPAAEELGRSGLPVLILPMESPCVDARATGIDATRLPDGRVRVRGSVYANAPRSRRVRIQRIDGESRRTTDLSIQERLLSGPSRLSFVDSSPGDGVVEYRLSLLPPDILEENDALSTLLMPSTRNVAVISRDQTVLDTLRASEPRFSMTGLPPSEAPTRLRGWLAYSAVLLVDPRGELLDADQRHALAGYVRSGGGLVLLGTGPSRSPMDRQDPLNSVAALMANPYERQPVNLTVLLDASGSMAEVDVRADGTDGRVKFAMAADATLALSRHLTPRDRLAVITFSDEAERIYDSGDAPPDFMALRKSLAAVTPTGPTDIAPALAEATRASASEGRTGLVLVLSDLATRPFDSAEAAEWLRKAGERLAVVAVRSREKEADGASELELLALRMAAPIRRTDSLVALAETFADLISESRGSMARKGVFKLGSGRPFGVSAAPLAAVTAYLPCGTWPDSEVLLSVSGDPFIARRSVEAGRSVSIALAHGEGLDTEWLQSPGVDRLLEAAVRWSARPSGDGRFTGTVMRDGTELRVILEAKADAEDVDQLSPNLQAHAMDSASPYTVPFEQVGPGRYSATLPVTTGPLSLIARRKDQGILWRQTVDGTYAEEFGDVGADWRALRRLADATGGRIVTSDEMQVELSRKQRMHDLHSWPWLASLSAIAMLLEWSFRRR